MSLGPVDVQQKTFGTALRGYDLDEVDEFLDEVVMSLDSYEQRLAEANALVRRLKQEAEERGDAEGAISRALLAAQRSADTIVSEAQEEADRTLADARYKAERILADARHESHALETERERIRNELTEEIGRLRATLADLRGRVAALSASVEADLSTMDAALDEAASEMEHDIPSGFDDGEPDGTSEIDFEEEGIDEFDTSEIDQDTGRHTRVEPDGHVSEDGVEVPVDDPDDDDDTGDEDAVAESFEDVGVDEAEESADPIQAARPWERD